MPKLKLFRVHYTCSGQGSVLIRATSKKQAENKFYDWDIIQDDNDDDNHELFRIDPATEDEITCQHKDTISESSGVTCLDCGEGQL